MYILLAHRLVRIKCHNIYAYTDKLPLPDIIIAFFYISIFFHPQVKVPEGHAWYKEIKSSDLFTLFR